MLRIADRQPEVRAEREKYPGSTREVFLKGAILWQVSYYAKTKPGEPRKEIAQVIIDDRSGGVVELWTGFRVPWTMARGYDGAFGKKVNAPYVWIPLLVLFVVPFVQPRRPFSAAAPRPARAVRRSRSSLAFFNAAEIETSVPLVAPLLAYLLGRMLWIGAARRRAAAAPPQLLVPVSWLGVGLVFLVGFRIGLNLIGSNVIDVGYAGVIGADRLADGDPLYGGWPTDNEHGDTYGPLAYAAYLPFEQVLPWSGTWDDLPAAHGAAITFDLLTLAGVFLLGRRVGGTDARRRARLRVGGVPVHALRAEHERERRARRRCSSSAALLVATSAPARGAVAALAGADEARAARARRRCSPRTASPGCRGAAARGGCCSSLGAFAVVGRASPPC